MKEYEFLLKKAVESLPKRNEGVSRFKPPQIASEMQGSKTVIKNFSEIAAVLRRDANHIAKFLFKELAAHGNIQGNSLILQTKVSRENLQKRLVIYIRDFVYCKICGQPDTKLEKVDRIVFLVCEACGARSPTRAI